MAQGKGVGGGWIALAAVVLGVAYCHDRSSSADAARTTSTPLVESAVDDGASAEADTDDAPSDDEEVRGGETYQQYDERRDELETGLYSGGGECTVDCGGHDAGRAWAERRGISDPDDCGGRSWSFEEGCRSYAREQQGSDDDEQGEDETS